MKIFSVQPQLIPMNYGILNCSQKCSRWCGLKCSTSAVAKSHESSGIKMDCSNYVKKVTKYSGNFEFKFYFEFFPTI